MQQRGIGQFQPIFQVKGNIFRLMFFLADWLLYNFAAGRFHTKKLCSRLYSIEVDLHSKKPKIAFWATLSRLRGNVRTPPKSYSSLESSWSTFYSSQLNFFAVSYGWDVISGNLSKSTFFLGGGSISANIWQGMGHRLPTSVGVRRLKWSPFRVVPKYPQCIIYFGHNTRIWRTDGRTNGRTDRQNCDSNTVRCITCHTVKTASSACNSSHVTMWPGLLAYWL